ncbi:MAG TPA: DUF4388 domain-containing protein, partial [Candidatus Acidoferrum sp.]|nr:DUF4388 domain-containing protein [Candidatus Acidoferrum sp.]
QVIARLRQDLATTEIPVMFISPLGASKDTVRGLDLAAEDYPAKPVDSSELRARVQRVLQKIRPPHRVIPMASGQLSAMNLMSLIQMFEGERGAACLLLTRGEAHGGIVVTDGKISQAAQGRRKGKAAVYQLLTWREGTFDMMAPDASGQVEGPLDAPIQALLMEGVRRLDEIPGLRSALTNPPLRMEVPPILRETIQVQSRPANAAVVSLLDGTRDLDGVLAESPLDEWATLKILDSLRQTRALLPVDTGREQRGGLRLLLEVPIEYQNLQSFQKSTAFSLTANGVFLRTATPFDMGDQVVLRFQLPGQEAHINVTGQVVWRNMDPNKMGGVGMGIRFIEAAADMREAIERHLAQAIAVQVSDAEKRE